MAKKLSFQEISQILKFCKRDFDKALQNDEIQSFLSNFIFKFIHAIFPIYIDYKEEIECEEFFLMTFKLLLKSEVVEIDHKSILYFALMAAASSFMFYKELWNPILKILWLRENKISFKVKTNGSFSTELDLFDSENVEFEDECSKETLLGNLLRIIVQNTDSKQLEILSFTSKERTDRCLNTALIMLLRKSKHEECFAHECDRQNDVGFNLMIILRYLGEFQDYPEEIGNQISRSLGTATFKWMECIRQGFETFN